MGFTLKIDFECLNFFVPDPETGRMHILMPSTCHPDTNDPDPIDEHHVNLVYPLPGGRLNSSDQVAKAGEARVKDYVDMKGWGLVLGAGAEPADLTLRYEVVDITPHSGPVDRALVVDAFHPRVASRVTLESGKLDDTVAAAVWKFDGVTIEIAQQVIWTMDLPGDGLTWSRYRLKADGDDLGESDIQALPYIPAVDGTVVIEIYHTTRRAFPVPETPPDLEGDVVAKHFGAFYTLFAAPHDRKIPELLKNPEDKPLTCMGASGRLAAPVSG